MPKVTYIEPSGNQVEIDVPVGWSVMQSAMSNGVEGIEAECGGSCACATCHCYVESHADVVPAAGETELSMLGNVVAERKPNSRLCCQIKMTPELEGLVVRFPDAQS
ncbi:MAG: 2Fe-2S iron-sulfur cluster binding domain-containing protein [Rhodocyclaceae bacterium]|nr:2Fe-2S iron-sulfur cluster binding domain-containing protein [Rhodocyclaceae bacterium]